MIRCKRFTASSIIARQNQVDVFFTQMWADVEWNVFPGAGRLQSAPKSVEDFAQGLATLMEYLVKTRHYTCIRWLCIVNEPGYEWSWWQGPDGKAVEFDACPARCAGRTG